MTSERRIIYINVSDMAEHDVKQVRDQLLKLGNEPILVLRQRAWVAFLVGALIGAVVAWAVLRLS